MDFADGHVTITSILSSHDTKTVCDKGNTVAANHDLAQSPQHLVLQATWTIESGTDAEMPPLSLKRNVPETPRPPPSPGDVAVGLQGLSPISLQYCRSLGFCPCPFQVAESTSLFHGSALRRPSSIHLFIPQKLSNENETPFSARCCVNLSSTNKQGKGSPRIQVSPKTWLRGILASSPTKKGQRQPTVHTVKGSGDGSTAASALLIQRKQEGNGPAGNPVR